jgi:site-specific recombinase XerD
MYADKAGLIRTVHPHLLRHQMLTFLTAQGLTDAKIQLLSGHGNRASLELYQHLSLASI